jgi:trigger factor
MANPPRGRRRRKPPKASPEEQKKREQAKQEAERKDKQRKAGRRVALEGTRALQDMVKGPQKAKNPLAGVMVAPSDDVTLDMSVLEGIEVEVPIEQDVTDAQLDARIDELIRAHSPVRGLPDGEALQAGDEVLMDVMGYVDGDPFLAQNDEWMSVVPNPLLPGLFEEIAQGTAGEHKVVRTILPDAYPDARHAGKAAAFVIHIKAANRVDKRGLDDRELLEAIDKGDNAEQVREAVRGELTVELADVLVRYAQRLVLDEVERRTDIDTPEDAVEAELLRLWRFHEGDAMTHGGASKAELEAAKKTWFEHPDRREEVRRAIWAERLLDAIAHDQGFEANADEVVKIVVQSASAAELPVSDVHTSLMNDEEMRAIMAQKLKRQHAMEWLLGKAKVDFGG